MDTISTRTKGIIGFITLLIGAASIVFTITGLIIAVSAPGQLPVIVWVGGIVVAAAITALGEKWMRPLAFPVPGTR